MKTLTKSEQDEVIEWLDHIEEVRGLDAREFSSHMLDELHDELKLHYVRTVSADRRKGQRRSDGRTGGRRSTDES